MAKNDSLKISEDTEEISKPNNIFAKLYKKFEKEIKFATISNIVSTSICIVISFYLNSKYVWKTKKSVSETAPGFLVVSLFSAWIVQSIAINAVIGIWGDSALISAIAKLCGSACGMISNYFGYKVIFSVDFKKYLRKLKK